MSGFVLASLIIGNDSENLKRINIVKIICSDLAPGARVQQGFNLFKFRKCENSENVKIQKINVKMI